MERLNLVVSFRGFFFKSTMRHLRGLLKNRLVVGGGIGIFVATFSFIISQIEVFETLELRLLDYRYPLKWKDTTSSNIIIILIDEEFKEEDFPFLFKELLDKGARVLCFDVFLKDEAVKMAIEELAFANPLNSIIYPIKFILKRHIYYDLGEHAYANKILASSHIIMPYHRLAFLRIRSSMFGQTNTCLDLDGKARHVPVVVEYEDRFYPALGVQAVNSYLEDRREKGEEEIEIIPGKRVKVRGISIPIDKNGLALINYYRDMFKTYKASQVITHHSSSIPPHLFKDRIVFIGAKESIPTPLRIDSPEILVQATIANNILEGEMLRKANGFTDFLLTVLLGILIGLSLRFRHLSALIYTILTFSCFVILSFLAFSLGVVVDVLPEILTTLFCFPLVTIYGYALTERKIVSSLDRLKYYNQSVIDSMNSGLIVVDREGKITTFNNKAREILGIDKDLTVIGLHFEQVFEGMKELSEVLRYLLTEQRNFQNFEFEHDNKNIILNTSILKDRRNELIGGLVVFQDVTMMKRLQAEVELKKRLSAIGELGAKLAHSLRNPLGAILGASKLLRDEMECDNEYLKIILDEGRELNNLIEEFLNFSKPFSMWLQEVDINEILEDSLSFSLQNVERDNIIIKKELAYDLPKVKVDINRIKEVFMNLIDNALSSMPDGGELSIRSTFNVQRSTIEVEFKDTGCGISKENIGKIFDPFFTTKEKGTGLGLSIVHKIIELHKGKIECQSEVGKGTIFTIELPCG
ncbi:MAG: CHASE2 domain-containing protein [bacterium]|nr:CHASE2 domain-containing protein [bacterium]